MNKAILLIGGNKPNTLQLFEEAQLLANNMLGHVIQKSEVYKTKAWGNTAQDDFYNQAWVVNTSRSPQETLELILSIEKQLGRVRQKKWEPRTIDIDIIFFNHAIIQQPSLVIPHPLMQNRKFVLVPLHEIIPTYIHPILNKSVAELLLECSDGLSVEMI